MSNLQSPSDENGNLFTKDVSGESEIPNTSYQVYRKRFFVLFLFVLYSMSNAFQWIQYAIIATPIMKFFDIQFFFVSLTSLVFMIIYIPGIFPASYLLTKKGLRFCVLLGAFGTCLGSLIKCGVTLSSHFWILMVGQSVVAASQLFIINIPPNLAAVWFPLTEVSSATAVGVFGNQLGIALGFLIPPELVSGDNIAHGLQTMHISMFVVTLVLLICIVIFFDEKPPTPPSTTQEQSEKHNLDRAHGKVLRTLFKNVDFNLLFITYGINVGVFYAVSTLLEQLVVSRFENSSEAAGRMGLLITISGMIGSVVCGIILDKTHLFKLTTLILYALSFIGMIAFTFFLYLPVIWPMFIVSIFLGFFMTGYLPIGFEFAAELTYPQPEGTSAGLLNASAQVFGILFVILASYILGHYGQLCSNLSMCAMLAIGTLLTCQIRNKLNRQNAMLNPQSISSNSTNPLPAQIEHYSKI